MLCAQEGIASAEKELEQARAQLAEEQAEAAARSSAMAEESERLHADARKLQEARRAWSEGEQERRGAAALLEEARAEAARIKASNFLCPDIPCFHMRYCSYLYMCSIALCHAP